MLFNAPVFQADICAPATSQDLAARMAAQEFHAGAKLLRFEVEVHKWPDPVFIRTSSLTAYGQTDLPAGPHIWPLGPAGQRGSLNQWSDDLQFEPGMKSLPVDWFSRTSTATVRIAIYWTPALALITPSTSSARPTHDDPAFAADAPDELRGAVGLFVVPRGSDRHAQLRAWPKARATWPLFEALWKTRGLDGQDFPNLAQPCWPCPAKVPCDVPVPA